MNNNFKTGFFKTILYYASGFIIAYITYLVFGWDYKHAPGLHHLVGLFFLIGGAGWVLYYFALLVAGEKSKINIGTLTVHLLAIVSFILFIAINILRQHTTE